MTRETSIESYRQMIADGVLPQKQAYTNEMIKKFGPCTANELQAKVVEYYGPKNAEILMGLDKRLSELRDRWGTVKELPRRACKISGKSCIVWESTGADPERRPKPKKIKCKSCSGRGYHMQESLF